MSTMKEKAKQMSDKYEQEKIAAREKRSRHVATIVEYLAVTGRQAEVIYDALVEAEDNGLADSYGRAEDLWDAVFPILREYPR